MKRNIHKLSHDLFDVVIIGGGVYGALISFEMARQGVKTALIEKDDFSHATSANSLKILHGGLRYLQNLNIKRMRKSIKSRRDFIRFAPQLIKPLACVIPLYGYGLKSREIMQTALFLNDIIGKDRNKGIDLEKHLPNGEIISAQKCLDIIPGIQKEGLRGGALWYDALAIDTERLVTDYLKEAYQYGACVANYVEAKEFVINDKSIKGINAIDVMNGSSFTIRTNLVINAAGPWFEKLISDPLLYGKKEQGWAKSINIIINKPLFDAAVGLESKTSYKDKDAVLNKGTRFYFFVPWEKKYTMIGTTYEFCSRHPDDNQIKADDIKMFVNEVNAIYPPAQLHFEDVCSAHCGFLPASGISGDDRFNVHLEKNTKIIDHKIAYDMDGIISIKSIKYTTAPENAKKIAKYICKYKLKKSDIIGSARRDPANSKINKDFSSNQIDGDIIKHLKSVYGNSYKDVLKYAGGKEEEWISRNPPLTRSEINYFIQEEMAVRLSDIVFRCTMLGAAKCPETDLLFQIANIAGDKLGWDSHKKEKEINSIIDHFKIFKSSFFTKPIS